MLDEYLSEVIDCGSATVRLTQLYRYLRKGNRAAGTWKALLDAWEGLGQRRNDLMITELPNERLLLSRFRLERVTEWAGE